LFFCSFPQILIAKERYSGWATMEYQFDTRGFNVLNFTGFSLLPYGFSVWGFTDIEGTKNSNEREDDFATHFTEIDLKSPTWNDIGVVAELNSTTGDNNDVGRFGLAYVTKLDLFEEIDLLLIFKGFPVETDGDGGQIVFAWNAKFHKLFDDRLSIGGFTDTNFRSGNDLSTHIVSETQFRFRLINGFHLLLEAKFNDFLPSEKTGLGIGIQYHF
jgi:hypothetical protein